MNFSCFALLAFCCIFAGVSGGALLALAAALHEAAHLAALGIFHAAPEAVTLTALGCRIVPRREKFLNGWKSCAVSLAGPGANLAAYGVLALAGRGSGLFAGSNLALGLLHSLPIEPLDGGLALRSAAGQVLGWERAGRLSRIVSAILLLPLAALGFLILLRTRYNFSLLALSLYGMLYLALGRDYLPE